MIDALQYGICAAILGTAFAGVQPGLFAWWFKFLLWIEPHTGEWLTKPLGLCAMCTSGQIGLWWHILTFGFSPWAILSASTAILAANLLTKMIEWNN